MQKYIVCLLVCIVLVLFSYNFIDQSLAKAIYDYNLTQAHFFKWVTYIPNLLVYLFTLALISMVSTGKINLSLNNFQLFIIAVSLGNYITLVLVKLSKIIFGRIGPEYWAAHQFNLQDYGFYWLQGNATNYQDFPSGHTSVMFTILAIVWSLAPKLRLLGIFLSLLVVISLLFTQSHFLADCIAGAFLGSLVGYKTLRFLV